MKIKQLIYPIVCASLFLGIPSSTFASPAKDSSIDQLMQLSNITDIFEQSNREMQPFFDAKAEELVRHITKAQTFDITQQNAVLQISALYSEIHQGMTKDPKFIALFKGLFKKTFTEEEVQANIAFLNTPLGQSINKKTNGLMTDIMMESSKFAQERMQNAENQQALRQKLEKIIAPLIKPDE